VELILIDLNLEAEFARRGTRSLSAIFTQAARLGFGVLQVVAVTLRRPKEREIQITYRRKR
jgi:hypothetical protein